MPIIQSLASNADSHPFSDSAKKLGAFLTMSQFQVSVASSTMWATGKRGPRPAHLLSSSGNLSSPSRFNPWPAQVHRRCSSRAAICWSIRTADCWCAALSRAGAAQNFLCLSLAASAGVPIPGALLEAPLPEAQNGELEPFGKKKPPRDLVLPAARPPPLRGSG